MNCTLSIIIPVLNDAAALEQLLLSLRMSSLTHGENTRIEMIVVDGGSSDHSVDIAKQYTSAVLQSSQGRAQQMHIGAAHANGRMLWFVHADALISPILLDEMLRIAECDGWGRCNVRLDHSAQIFRVIEFMMNWRSRLTGIATGDQGIFIERERYVSVGGYGNGLLMEDVGICRRLKKRSRPLLPSGVISVSSRRWAEHGIVKTILLMWWLRLLFFMGVPPNRLYRMYYRK